MLDRIVFVLRQSPDWSALASDYEAGRDIEESRYKPSGYIEGFPDDITEHIRVWNKLFPVNFFRCRAELKDIAMAQLRRVEQSVILSEKELARLPELMGDQAFLLFFLDDDDWFGPETFAEVSGLDLAGANIAVFPLVRFEMNTFTFVRDNESARQIIGSRRDFNYRFQTNNYAVSRKIALSPQLLELRDHCAASRFATESAMTDVYFDIIISATNKTPCSASLLPWMMRNPEGYKSVVQRYVDNLAALEIPHETAWCKDPVDRTIRLLRALL